MMLVKTDTPQGEMVRLARLSRGKTQRCVAELCGFAHGRLSKIENEIAVATDHEIKTIGDILDYPVGFFYRRDTMAAYAWNSDIYH